MTISVATVVGNGPGGVATAALLAGQGAEVTLFGRSATKVQRFIEAGGMTVIEDGTPREVTGISHSSDLTAAVKGARHVILVVPTSAIPDYAAAMAPVLEPDALVLLAPGHTGGALAFRHAVGRVRPELADMTVAESFTLPFVTRMTGPSEVTIWRRMANLITGVIPASRTAETIAVFSSVFPDMVPASSVLESSLQNLNAIMHPPGMLGNIGWIESTGGGFRFYREGVTPGIARLMDAVDDERRAVAAAFGLEVPSFVELFCAAGLVEPDVAAKRDTHLAVHESGPNLEIMSPGSLTDRYVEEDVGFGLVALAELGRCAAVPTPVTNAMITIASAVNEREYAETGLTAERMGIDGLDCATIRELVE